MIKAFNTSITFFLRTLSARFIKLSRENIFFNLFIRAVTAIYQDITIVCVCALCIRYSTYIQLTTNIFSTLFLLSLLLEKKCTCCNYIYLNSFRQNCCPYKNINYCLGCYRTNTKTPHIKTNKKSAFHNILQRQMHLKCI